MKRMTFKQILSACNNHKYIIFRHGSGFTAAFNSKIAQFSIEKHKPNMESESKFISYQPCSFNQYISNKIGLV